MRNVTVETARSPLIAPEWQLIAFLWFCYVLNHADRQVVYTLFPALQKTFGFSNAVLGLTGALFLWVFGVFSPIAGVLGDRFSKTAIMLASLTVWSVLTVLSGLSPNGTFLLGCRALLGVSESFFMPAGYAIIAAAHGPRTRSRAMAIFGTSQLIGVAAGGSLSAFIAQRFDWRVSFWLLGGIGIIFVLPLSRFFRRMPSEFTRTEIGASASLTSFFVLFKVPTVRILAFAIAVATFGLFLVYTWLPTFLYDKFQIGLARAGFEASVYPQVGTACGLLVGGWLADHFNPKVKASRFWVIVIALFCGAPCMFLLGWTSRVSRSAPRCNRRGFLRGLYHRKSGAGEFRCGSPQTARFCYRRTEPGIGVCFGLCAVSGRIRPQHNRRESVDVVYGCDVPFYRSYIALRSLTALQNGQNR